MHKGSGPATQEGTNNTQTLLLALFLKAEQNPLRALYQCPVYLFSSLLAVPFYTLHASLQELVTWCYKILTQTIVLRGTHSDTLFLKALFRLNLFSLPRHHGFLWQSNQDPLYCPVTTDMPCFCYLGIDLLRWRTQRLVEQYQRPSGGRRLVLEAHPFEPHNMLHL